MNQSNDERSKDEVLSMCGFRCDLCKAYTANVEKNDERAELVAVWKKYYGFEIPVEEASCGGCRNIKAVQLDSACGVRICATEKGILHCGECNEYPCLKFKERVGLSFEDAQKKLGDDFDPGEYDKYLSAFDNVARLNELKNAK